MKKVIYYSDELNEEFSDAVITPKKIDKDYVYVHKSKWKRFTHFFWLRIVAHPIARFYLVFHYHHKIINRAKLKGYQKDSYFLFGNHTHFLCDALIPAKITKSKDCYVIVHPANVSMPYLGRITPSLGAVPLPDDKEAMRNFLSCIDTRVKEKCAIAIYPEAHIWPFYTHIRPFKDTSFRYPIEQGKPVFAFTNVYCKRNHGKTPTIHTYIDGPFFPDLTLPKGEARRKLRDEVYSAMCKRAELSNIEVIQYIKKEEAHD